MAKEQNNKPVVYSPLPGRECVECKECVECVFQGPQRAS